MALAFDTTHRPRRPAEWSALLEAIFNANQADETHALEWKGAVDLTDRQEVARSVAREILAMANRQVSTAMEHFDGYGILVIGVEPQTVHRIAVLDTADLDPKVTQFIGADGPAWEPRYIRFRGEECLIIDVAPPVAGDRIFALRKPIPATQKFRTGYLEGAVFVRRKASAVQAIQADFDLLLRRAETEVPQQTLNVQVTCVPASMSSFTWDESNVENWIDGQRRRLMQSVVDAKRKQEADEKAAILGHVARAAGFGDQFKMLQAIENAGSGLTERVEEKRSEAAFTADVEEWILTLRNEMASMPERFGSFLAITPKIEVHNPTEVNYSEVAVRLTMTGAVEVFETKDEAPELRYVLTDPPRPFGPYTKSRYIGPYLRGSDFPPPTRFEPPAPQTRRTNGGSFVLEPPSIDLRPFATETIEAETVILVPAHRADPPILEWTATATNVNGAAKGAIQMGTEGPLDLFSAFLEACESQRWPYRI